MTKAAIIMTAILVFPASGGARRRASAEKQRHTDARHATARVVHDTGRRPLRRHHPFAAEDRRADATTTARIFAIPRRGRHANDPRCTGAQADDDATTEQTPRPGGPRTARPRWRRLRWRRRLRSRRRRRRRLATSLPPPDSSPSRRANEAAPSPSGPLRSCGRAGKMPDTAEPQVRSSRTSRRSSSRWPSRSAGRLRHEVAGPSPKPSSSPARSNPTWSYST